MYCQYELKWLLKNAKYEFRFWNFNLKFELKTPLVFSFSETFLDEYYYENKSEVC